MLQQGRGPPLLAYDSGGQFHNRAVLLLRLALGLLFGVAFLYAVQSAIIVSEWSDMILLIGVSLGFGLFVSCRVSDSILAHIRILLLGGMLRLRSSR